MLPSVANSLPKSGTHLVGRALKIAGYAERPGIFGEQMFQSRSALRRGVKRVVYAPFPRSYTVGIDIPVRVGRIPIDRRLRNIHEAEFCMAHLGYSKPLVETIEDLGLVPLLIIRDPRAVLASFVPHVLREPGNILHDAFRELEPEQRYHAVLDGGTFDGLELRPLRDRCAVALAPWFESDQTLVLRFEDLIGPQGGGSEQAQRDSIDTLFARLEIPRDRAPKVVDELFGGSRTFRKGSVDSWRQEIPESVQARFDATIGDVLQAWGYA